MLLQLATRGLEPLPPGPRITPAIAGGRAMSLCMTHTGTRRARLLWAVDHGVRRRSKQMAATLGVTGPQRLVIRLAARYPQASWRRCSTCTRAR